MTPRTIGITPTPSLSRSGRRRWLLQPGRYRSAAENDGKGVVVDANYRVVDANYRQDCKEWWEWEAPYRDGQGATPAH
jgi:hypothetical protein